MKRNIVSRVVGVNNPSKNVNKPEPDIETNILEGTMQAIMKEILH